jgi:hypothetical protein
MPHHRTTSLTVTRRVKRLTGWFRPAGKHRAPAPRSKDGALVAGAVAVVVAGILTLSGAVTVASPDVAPVAMETAVCQ